MSPTAHICNGCPIVRTCALLAEMFRHYDEPCASVAVLANGAPAVSFIESHGAQASVEDQLVLPAGSRL